MEDMDEGRPRNPWLSGGSNMNMNATTSQAELERAIQASLEQQQNRFQYQS